MDYFQPIFNKWSTCSVEDFQKLYDQHGSSFCWKSSDSNSTDTTTTTTTTTVSPATTTRVKPATTATTSKSENQQCIEFGGDRCMRNCKNVNFPPFKLAESLLLLRRIATAPCLELQQQPLYQ